MLEFLTSDCGWCLLRNVLTGTGVMLTGVGQPNKQFRHFEVWGVPDMGEWVVKALVIGFGAWVIWKLLQPQYVFEIRINRGQPSIRKGKVTTTFLGQVAAVCQECGVVQGWIAGVRQGPRIALRFSRTFPSGPQQRLRNEWALAD
jgi:hypothetical protein